MDLREGRNVGIACGYFVGTRAREQDIFLEAEDREGTGERSEYSLEGARGRSPAREG